MRTIFFALIFFQFGMTQKEVYEHAKKIAKTRNILFQKPTQKVKPGEIVFVSEIPEGSRKKYELRTATGQLILDRVVCPKLVKQANKWLSGYPANYGVSPGRFNVDGDPLDLVILGNKKYYESQAKRGKPKPTVVRYTTVIKMEECALPPCQENQWEQDWKVVGVDPADPAYKNVKTLADMPPKKLDELKFFFSNYKGLKKGHPQTRVTGYLGPKETEAFVAKFKTVNPNLRKKEISSCQKYMQATLKRAKKLKEGAIVPVDSKFLKCSREVFDPGVFASKDMMKTFLAYAGAQHLLYLGHKQITLSNYAAKMQNLKVAKETHYRFVAFDRPKNMAGNYASKGSGNPIFEWVKTKNRNLGCPKSFAKQHYEDNPVIDL